MAGAMLASAAMVTSACKISVVGDGDVPVGGGVITIESSVPKVSPTTTSSSSEAPAPEQTSEPAATTTTTSSTTPVKQETTTSVVTETQPTTVVVPTTVTAPSTVVVPTTVTNPTTVVVPTTVTYPSTVVVPTTITFPTTVLTTVVPVPTTVTTTLTPEPTPAPTPVTTTTKAAPSTTTKPAPSTTTKPAPSTTTKPAPTTVVTPTTVTSTPSSTTAAPVPDENCLVPAAVEENYFALNCPGVSLRRPSADEKNASREQREAVVNAEVLARINEVRARYGRAPLEANPELQTVSQGIATRSLTDMSQAFTGVNLIGRFAGVVGYNLNAGYDIESVPASVIVGDLLGTRETSRIAVLGENLKSIGIAVVGDPATGHVRAAVVSSAKTDTTKVEGKECDFPELGAKNSDGAPLNPLHDCTPGVRSATTAEQAKPLAVREMEQNTKIANQINAARNHFGATTLANTAELNSIASDFLQAKMAGTEPKLVPNVAYMLTAVTLPSSMTAGPESVPANITVARLLLNAQQRPNVLKATAKGVGVATFVKGNTVYHVVIVKN